MFHSIRFKIYASKLNAKNIYLLYSQLHYSL